MIRNQPHLHGNPELKEAAAAFRRAHVSHDEFKRLLGWPSLPHEDDPDYPPDLPRPDPHTGHFKAVHVIDYLNKHAAPAVTEEEDAALQQFKRAAARRRSK